MPQSTVKPRLTLAGHKAAIEDFAYSPDEKLLVSAGSGDRTWRIWDVASGTQRAVYTEIYDVETVAFSPDGRTVAAAYDDDSPHADRSWIKLLDLPTGRVRKIPNPTPGVHDTLDFSPDGRKLAAHLEVFYAVLYDLTAEPAQHRVLAHTGMRWPGYTEGVRFSPDGATLAVSATEFPRRGKKLDFQVWLWDVANQRFVTALKGPTRPCTALSFSPDGKYLAAASADGTVRIWYLFTGELRSTLKHRSHCETVSFSPDGRTVAAGCLAGTVRFWDVASERLLAEVRCDRVVTHLAYSRDGRTLTTCGTDKEIKLWDVAELLAAGRSSKSDGDGPEAGAQEPGKRGQRPSGGTRKPEGDVRRPVPDARK